MSMPWVCHSAPAINAGCLIERLVGIEIGCTAAGEGYEFTVTRPRQRQSNHLSRLRGRYLGGQHLPWLLVFHQCAIAQDEEDDERERTYHIKIANRKDGEEQRIAVLQVEEGREAVRYLIGHVEKIEDKLGQ